MFVYSYIYGNIISFTGIKRNYQPFLIKLNLKRYIKPHPNKRLKKKQMDMLTKTFFFGSFIKSA